MNVLVTSASRKVSLVESFRVALDGRGEVIAADITPWAAAMHRADRSVLVPRSDDDAFVDALLRLCVELRIGLLVPTRDEELPVLASHADEFQAIGTTVHVADPLAVDTCQDKQRFHDFCVQHGFPVPEQITAPTAATLPLFARPRRGKGGVGSMRIDRLEHLELLADAGAPLIFSRLIEAPEYTIDVFVARDRGMVSAVPRERISVVAGESYISRTVDDAELRSAAGELCTALQLRGHSTVQAFRWDGGLAFIEVNPRFGGAAALSFAAGAPSPTWLVQEVYGEPLSPPPGTYQAGLVMLRYTQDVFLNETALQR